MQQRTFDVREFGAVGDGRTDSTAAIQKALDTAADSQGAVTVPGGVYCCSMLRVPPRVEVRGDAGWSYRELGGAVLRLVDASSSCLLNLTGAIGATLTGLSLDGRELGAESHGILVDNAEYGEEDTIRIERCCIRRFTGDGIRLRRIFGFFVRQSMAIRNGGCGLWIRGWDALVADNCFSGNGKSGFGAYEENASITFTGNRVEWNREAGVLIQGGTHYNITGNYIDRSGGPGLWIRPRGDIAATVIAATGNLIYRSGKPEWCPADEPYASSQVFFDGVRGLTFCGNTLNAGLDDHAKGEVSPRFGIVCRNLRSSVIKDNVLHAGATENLVRDLGGHGEAVIVRDNVGTRFVPGQTSLSSLNAVLADPAW
ncbi:MAG: right-handed parallel beta-helix repeat-containing protein [Candidatus Pacebacteria bacterium]|nr:right-handed parallel beta-helix repeat-containing protein [Candidatus Paceibacterota bacterium]